MDLGFRDYRLDGTPVLSLRGAADLATLPRLQERVGRFAAEHSGRHVVIDLDELDSLEPIVLGVFIGARLQLRSSGGELDLVCTTPALRTLFERSDLIATFALHPSITAAVVAAGPNTGAGQRRPS